MNYVTLFITMYLLYEFFSSLFLFNYITFTDFILRFFATFCTFRIINVLSHAFIPFDLPMARSARHNLWMSPTAEKISQVVKFLFPYYHYYYQYCHDY